MHTLHFEQVHTGVASNKQIHTNRSHEKVNNKLNLMTQTSRRDILYIAAKSLPTIIHLFYDDFVLQFVNFNAQTNVMPMTQSEIKLYELAHRTDIGCCI